MDLDLSFRVLVEFTEECYIYFWMILNKNIVDLFAAYENLCGFVWIRHASVWIVLDP